MRTLREELNAKLDNDTAALESTLRISEIFGPTIQGEGSHMGIPCYFIRLGGCNLSCDWCDTPYSTGTHGIPLSTIGLQTVKDIATQIPTDTTVIITGGEPLMHTRRPAFQTLITALKARGCTIHIETNGTTLPTGQAAALIDHYTISPKLGVTMVNPRHKPTLANWEPFKENTILKTVWEPQAWDSINEFITHTKNLATQAGISPRNIWVMPEGATAEPLNQKWAELAQAAADNNINASHRLHALAWGDAKGH